MIYLRYTWDHIKREDFTNYLTPFEHKLPFAIRHIGSWTEGADYYTKRSFQGDYYLLYTASGCGKVSYRLHQLFLKKGDICLIDGSEMHSYKTEGKEPWHSIWFHLTGNGMANYFELINPPDTFNAVHLPNEEHVITFYENIKDQIKINDKNSALTICSLIVDMLNHILMNIDDTTEINESAKLLQSIKMYIESNLHTIVTQSQICTHFQLPLRQIQRLFIKYENINLHDYIRTRYEVVRTPDNENISVDHPKWLLDSISYINDNFTENIQIQDIIEKAHISKSVFIRAFKQYTAMRPHEYLTHVRLEHALYLLESTDEKLSTIASSCGFPSASNFTKRFKTWSGVSPSTYRESRQT